MSALPLAPTNRSFCRDTACLSQLIVSVDTLACLKGEAYSSGRRGQLAFSGPNADAWIKPVHEGE